VSLLGSTEYSYSGFGIFADVGAVHQPEGWTKPRLGLGLAVHFGAEAHLAIALRTDDRAGQRAQVQFFFSRSF
jgi:hypothetical protein